MKYKYRRPYHLEHFVKVNNFYIEFLSDDSELNPESRVIRDKEPFHMEPM